MSVATDYQDYDPAKHNPVFYGCMHHPVQTDSDIMQDVDVSKSHPSVIGYAFTEKPPESPVLPPPPLPDKKTCKFNFVVVNFFTLLHSDILNATELKEWSFGHSKCKRTYMKKITENSTISLVKSDDLSSMGRSSFERYLKFKFHGKIKL